MLADRDFEKISVAEIASHADCSIGAFYSRFRDKLSFVDSIIEFRFGAAVAQANSDLAAERFNGTPTAEVVLSIARHLVGAFTGETAGAARAAIKRAQSDRTALEPLILYRTAISERAVSLLKDRPKDHPNRKQTILVSMQVAFATTIDALLHDQGPLQAGTSTMSKELSRIILLSIDGAKTTRSDG